ncbi:heavy metal-binding domain-containing protein [Pseudopelagicola sp. nBUS_20]|uniref:heavy metal-binding domain-containing protein n=1 Tax=Pseudopelagicola sp. nBUS_20 TaxID=3395317 RepID=UPI003EC099B2
MSQLFVQFADEDIGENDIIVSQQAHIIGKPSTVIQIIAADMVTVDREESGLFVGLVNFIRTKPIHNKGALELAMTPISEALKTKARSLGADAVLNVRIHTTRGVEKTGSRLIRLSAVGTAVRFDKIE